MTPVLPRTYCGVRTCPGWFRSITRTLYKDINEVVGQTLVASTETWTEVTLADGGKTLTAGLSFIESFGKALTETDPEVMALEGAELTAALVALAGRLETGPTTRYRCC